MGLSYFVDSMYFLLVDRPKLIESFLGFQCYLKFICFSFQFRVFFMEWMRLAQLYVP